MIAPALDPRLRALAQELQPAPCTAIEDTVTQAAGVALSIQRDDLLHPVISGNKWQKLKYFLAEALANGCHTLVSMGGAYSNHLHALAYCGHKLGLMTRALVRGEADAATNPALSDVQHWGMRLTFLSRTAYRVLRADGVPRDLTDGEYWIPEGGAGPLALQGIGEWYATHDWRDTVLCVPCGSATTLAGMIQAAPPDVTVLGFSVLKGGKFLVDHVQRLLTRPARCRWEILFDYHCGGFAKTPQALLAFIGAFEQRHAIPLEPVYSGKMLYGLYDLIRHGYFARGQHLVALHTGGLQGRRGHPNFSPMAAQLSASMDFML